jgi:hypothetical protein
MARCVTDDNGRVRRAFFKMINAWMTTLSERFDYGMALTAIDPDASSLIHWLINCLVDNRNINNAIYVKWFNRR